MTEPFVSSDQSLHSYAAGNVLVNFYLGANAEALVELHAHQSGKGLRTESQFAGVRRWVERNKSGFLGGVIVAMLAIGLFAAIALLIWLVVAD